MEHKSTPVMKLLEWNWHTRAQVGNLKTYQSADFIQDRWDYLPELIPFNSHPLWQKLPESDRKLVASYGWIMYNMRTIFVETKMISPLCCKIIDRECLATFDYDFKVIASQTLVDEAYHTLLSVEGIQQIITNRNLPDVTFTELNLSKKYSEYLKQYNSNLERDIVQLAVVVATEALISDYLSLLASSTSVQRVCSFVAATHLRDELRHSNLFKSLAQDIIPHYNNLQIDILINTIIEASEWFLDQELDVWQEILLQLNLKDAGTIIGESREKTAKVHQPRDKRVAGLIELLKAIKT